MREWFVKQEKLGLLGEELRNGQSLPLATREGLHIPIG